jgi:hypothetical protein
MKAPFPYFGSKSCVASQVWKALGDCEHYMEPFFGSGAVLLNRKNFNPKRHAETVNDKDGFVSNVWRSMKYSPEETAEVCDWPVNHADLIARKAKLIANENYLIKNLCRDDKWHDTELAGYPAYTSQQCSRCGLLGQREGKKFKCLACGHVEDADVNAAFVIALRHQGILRLPADRDAGKGSTDTPEEATSKKAG